MVPEVSIIMSAFNEEKFLDNSLQSVLHQTFDKWELLITDDCSSDSSWKILQRYRSLDKRIRLFLNEKNKGLAKNLNMMIKEANSQIIVRFDCDDLMHKERLQKQFQFLVKNDDVSVVGSGANFIDSQGSFIKTVLMPETDNLIKKHLIKGPAFIHPSTMMRKSFLDSLNGYDENLKKAQDYDLWLRGRSKYEYANIQEPLISYRVRLKTNNLLSIKNSLLIRFKYFYGMEKLKTLFWFIKETLAYLKK